MKLLFYSPYTLLDSSSGAALCVATLLAELTKLGHVCAAVTGSVVDAKNPLFDSVAATKPDGSIAVSAAAPIPTRRVGFHGVTHFIVGSGVTAPQLTATDEVALRRAFLDGFAQFDPDVLLTYGGFVSNYYAGQHAMAKGRTSVLYVASDTYARGDAHQLTHVNMIHTVSEAMRARLATMTNLPIVATQTFVRRSDVVSPVRKPEYITFVNPTFEKGLKIAAAIVRECDRLKKPYKFLFIEGRGTRETLARDCPELINADNLHIGNNTNDVRQIYERTAVCLYPSLWFEPAGRVPIEANANGIPVLACRSGGISEMLDGAGFLFDPPDASRQDFDAEVPSDYIARWINALDMLHGDPALMADAVSRARAADARYDTARMATTFADAVGRAP